MPNLKVYLDSNVYKFSAAQMPGYRPREVTVNWGGHKQTLTVHDEVTENANDQISNPQLKAEADLLPEVAALGTSGLLTFQISVETNVEIGGLPKMFSLTGNFYGAPREMVDPPVKYGRILYGSLEGWEEEQYRFLCSLNHPRFHQLQRITGAYQGTQPANRNQLLDAFHLWCAEHNGSDYFLTLDFKPARVVEKARNKPSVPVVRPSELLNAIRRL
jgi:hypothetical protein